MAAAGDAAGKSGAVCEALESGREAAAGRQRGASDGSGVMVNRSRAGSVDIKPGRRMQTPGISCSDPSCLRQ